MSRPAVVAGRRGAPFAVADPAETTAAFVCAHCGNTVSAVADGTSHRNHCPRCLWSLHVDVRPGDRAALCRAPMEPVALWTLQGGEQRVIHRCTRCGVLKANRVAGDDDSHALLALVPR